MVRAISNNYTTESTGISLTWSSSTVRKSNGETTLANGASSHRRDFHSRSNYSSNSFRMIPGIKPFRDPSTYTRRMVNLMNYTPADYTKEDSTYVTKTKGFKDGTIADYVYLFTYPINELADYKPNWEIDQATTECLAKLQEGKVNVAQFLAESVRSADMIALAAIDLFKALKAVKRGRNPFKGKGGFSGPLANGYLAYQYGWKPLASDLYNMYQEFVDPRDKPMVIGASRSVIGRHSDTRDSGVWINRRQNIVNLAQVKIFATVRSEFLTGLNRDGLLNPLSLGWELVPYSFVVDWALPVGTFLEALNASVGLNFLSGYTMQRTSCKVSGDRKLPSGTVGKPAHFAYETLSIERKKLGGFPKPVIYAKNPFKTSNVIAATALWRQLLK